MADTLASPQLAEPPALSVYQPSVPTPRPEIVAALAAMAPLAGLSAQHYDWIARHGEERRGGHGCIIFHEGEPACHLIFLLTGDIHVRRRQAGPMGLWIGRAGQLNGKLPFSRMTHYGGEGYAVGEVWALRLHQDLFPELLAAVPAMAQISVSIMLDRVREVTRLEQQAQKLSALGKLAANLAHELNNPASAAQRTAASLFAELRQYGDKKYKLGALCLTPETAASMHGWMRRVREQIADFTSPDPLEGQGVLGPIDREAEILTWLQRHNVEGAWEIAPPLAESRIPIPELESFAASYPVEVLGPAMGTLASSLRVERMAETIVSSTVRIFDFISAIKDYSYMDQAPIQAVDLAQSLDNTLSMFGSQRSGIRVERDYSPEVPLIRAYGSELNQVWTALIENALDAMPQGGTLCLRVAPAGQFALVEVWDTGQGIADELKSRIFEPFFTTKTVGAGLGLGLDTAQRIVSRHSGFVTVESKPGQTCFQVRLPLDRAEAY